MATNFKGPASPLTILAPAAATSGVPLVASGKFYGITQASASSGASVAVVTEGVYSFDKTTGSAYAVGDLVWWDVAASKTVAVTDPGYTSGTDPMLGMVVEAAGSAATTARVAILPFVSQFQLLSSAGLASTAGAALIGIADAGGKLTATTVEAALAEMIRSAPTTVTTTDDDSAASNGTDLMVTISADGWPYLISETANNAPCGFHDSAANVFFVGDDAVGSVGDAVYSDPATGWNADLGNMGDPAYVDIWDLTRSVAVRITNNNGTPVGDALHIDDDGGTPAARVLSVTTGNASFTTATRNK